MKLSRLLPVLMGGEAQMDPELAALLANMTPDVSGSNVALYYEPTGYWLVRPVGNGLCVGYSLGFETALTADAPAPTIYTTKLFHAVKVVDNAGLTESGTFTSSSNVVYYGGVRRQSADAGAYVEYTTPANTVEVGALQPTASQGGIILVSIDGDNTAATLLRTAQQLVDASELDATALVANGGTLNPTDRVINQQTDAKAGVTVYPFKFLRFATGLPPASYTVRLTRTGYKDPTAGDTTLLVDAIFYRVSGVDMPDTDVLVLPISNITYAESRWEYAFNFKPTGATAADWMGHYGSEKNRINGVIKINGTPTAAPTTSVPLIGKTIAVDIDAYLRHPETGATDVGLVTRTYTLTATELKHTFNFTWKVGGSVNAAYPAMLASDATLDRGSMVGDVSDYTLTADDGSETADVDSQAGYLWDADGNWAVAMYIPNLATVLNYSAANCGMWIQDRAGGTNKLYAERNVNTLAILANDVWTADVRFLANYFPDGAETALARLA